MNSVAILLTINQLIVCYFLDLRELNTDTYEVNSKYCIVQKNKKNNQGGSFLCFCSELSIWDERLT